MIKMEEKNNSRITKGDITELLNNRNEQARNIALSKGMEPAEPDDAIAKLRENVIIDNFYSALETLNHDLEILEKYYNKAVKKIGKNGDLAKIASQTQAYANQHSLEVEPLAEKLKKKLFGNYFK